MEFFSISNPRLITFRPVRPLVMKKSEYRFSVDCNGFKYLVKSGEKNLNDEVNSFKNDCSIHNLLQRYSFGDTSVLSRKVPSQFNSIDRPTTLQEALNLSIKLKNNFNSLNPDVKSSFDNDFTKFLASITDGSFNDIISKHTIKEVPDDGSQQ